MEEWSNWFEWQWYIGYFGVFQLVLYHEFSPFGTDPRFCGSVSRGFGSWWGTPGTFLLLHTNFNFIYLFNIKHNRECTKLIMIFNFETYHQNSISIFFKSTCTCWQLLFRRQLLFRSVLFKYQVHGFNHWQEKCYIKSIYFCLWRTTWVTCSGTRKHGCIHRYYCSTVRPGRPSYKPGSAL